MAKIVSFYSHNEHISVNVSEIEDLGENCVKYCGRINGIIVAHTVLTPDSCENGDPFNPSKNEIVRSFMETIETKGFIGGDLKTILTSTK